MKGILVVGFVLSASAAGARTPRRTANGATYGPNRKTKQVLRYLFSASALKPSENRIAIAPIGKVTLF